MSHWSRLKPIKSKQTHGNIWYQFMHDRSSKYFECCIEIRCLSVDRNNWSCLVICRHAQSANVVWKHSRDLSILLNDIKCYSNKHPSHVSMACQCTHYKCKSLSDYDLTRRTVPRNAPSDGNTVERYDILMCVTSFILSPPPSKNIYFAHNK